MLNTISIKPILLTDADNAVDTSMTMDTANAVLVSALAAVEGDEPVYILGDMAAVGEAFKRKA